MALETIYTYCLYTKQLLDFLLLIFYSHFFGENKFTISSLTVDFRKAIFLSPALAT